VKKDIINKDIKYTDKLVIENLSVYYRTEKEVVKAVNNINLSISKGESIGIVGETGAGKTTLALSIMGLLPKETGKIENGSIFYDGKDLLKSSELDMRKVRGDHISMIFQDPMTSLNPILTVVEQISEVIEEHEDLDKKAAIEKAADMLEMVGIPRTRMNDYPHQFSGGMKQRVVIAIALACSPKILLADEPTTALDVTIQAQIISMISDLRKRLDMSLMLITHDLGVVAQVCDKVAIIYAGEIIEFGDIKNIFTNSKHPYTRGLFEAIPNLHKKMRRLKSIPGLIPDPANLPIGCSFQDRCSEKLDICSEKKPDMKGSDEHKVACFAIDKVVL
jgi:peptide/nickel transport system ATP-binding protein